MGSASTKKSRFMPKSFASSPYQPIESWDDSPSNYMIANDKYYALQDEQDCAATTVDKHSHYFTLFSRGGQHNHNKGYDRGQLLREGRSSNFNDSKMKQRLALILISMIGIIAVHFFLTTLYLSSERSETPSALQQLPTTLHSQLISNDVDNDRPSSPDTPRGKVKGTLHFLERDSHPHRASPSSDAQGDRQDSDQGHNSEQGDNSSGVSLSSTNVVRDDGGRDDGGREVQESLHGGLSDPENGRSDDSPATDPANPVQHDNARDEHQENLNGTLSDDVDKEPEEDNAMADDVNEPDPDLQTIMTTMEGMAPIRRADEKSQITKKQH